MKMEATYSSETSITILQITWHRILCGWRQLYSRNVGKFILTYMVTRYQILKAVLFYVSNDVPKYTASNPPLIYNPNNI
jgi:hypothetical protein